MLRILVLSDSWALSLRCFMLACLRWRIKITCFERRGVERHTHAYLFIINSLLYSALQFLHVMRKGQRHFSFHIGACFYFTFISGLKCWGLSKLRRRVSWVICDSFLKYIQKNLCYLKCSQNLFFICNKHCCMFRKWFTLKLRSVTGDRAEGLLKVSRRLSGAMRMSLKVIEMFADVSSAMRMSLKVDESKVDDYVKDMFLWDCPDFGQQLLHTSEIPFRWSHDERLDVGLVIKWL